jgi:hypothetical protein
MKWVFREITARTRIAGGSGGAGAVDEKLRNRAHSPSTITTIVRSRGRISTYPKAFTSSIVKNLEKRHPTR